jgi:hypothetical protein
MRVAMVALAVVCVGLALAPTVIVPTLVSVAASLPGGGAAPVTVRAFGTVQVADEFAGLSMLAIALVLIAGLAVPIVVLRAAGARRGRRVYETWGCGRMLQTSRMEYTATAFANPFKRVFDFFYQPEKRFHVETHAESRFFVSGMTYDSPTRSIFDDWLYRPALDVIRRTTGRARAIQSGSPNLYLAYILAALVLMLVVG